MITAVLLAILVALGQFQRIEWAGLPAFYIHEVLIALLAVWSIKTQKASTPVLAFFGALALSLVVNYAKIGNGFVEAGLYLIRVMLYGSLIASFKKLNSNNDQNKITHMVLSMVIVGLALGGIVQYLVYPDMRYLVEFGWDNHLYRAIGTLFDPNFLGLMMVLGIIFTSQQKKLALPLTGIIIICLILTYSRASYLSLGVVGIIWAIKTKKWRELAIALMIGVTVLFALPQRGGEGNMLLRSSSVTRRAESNQKAIEVFKKNPLFGIGFNAYKQVVLKSDSKTTSHPSSPDNSFLLILATSGIIGMGAFLYLVRWVVSQYKDDQVVMLSLIAVAIHSLFNNSLFYPWVMMWLALLFSLRTVTVRKKP